VFSGTCILLLLADEYLYRSLPYEEGGVTMCMVMGADFCLPVE